MDYALCQLYCILAIRPVGVISSLQLKHKTAEESRTDIMREGNKGGDVGGKGSEERTGEKRR